MFFENDSKNSSKAALSPSRSCPNGAKTWVSGRACRFGTRPGPSFGATVALKIRPISPACRRCFQQDDFVGLSRGASPRGLFQEDLDWGCTPQDDLRRDSSRTPLGDAFSGTPQRDPVWGLFESCAKAQDHQDSVSRSPQKRLTGHRLCDGSRGSDPISQPPESSPPLAKRPPTRPLFSTGVYATSWLTPKRPGGFLSRPCCQTSLAGPLEGSTAESQQFHLQQSVLAGGLLSPIGDSPPVRRGYDPGVIRQDCRTRLRDVSWPPSLGEGPA